MAKIYIAKKNDVEEGLQQYGVRLNGVEAAQTALGTNMTTLETTVSGKQNKATDPEGLGVGYLYQKSDGSVVLTEANPKFKYTIIVDNGVDGNPAAVEYADDAVGMTPASGSNLGSWGNTELLKKYFRPCVIKKGADSPTYFLDPTNLKKKMDGTASVLTGSDGDVMVQVKKLYGKFAQVENGKVACSISNVREDGSWFCWNEVAGVEKEYRYRGRYMAGFATDNETEIRSISGVPRAANKNRATFRALATAMGPQYYQNDIYMVFLWEFMYLLIYKNRNSQASLGKNLSRSTSLNCGWSDAYGCCFGEQTSTTNGVVFLWVEDFYGGIWEFVDGGIFKLPEFKLTRDPSKYNDTGDGYEITIPVNLNANGNSRYINKMKMVNDAPFVPDTAEGASSATFWCDAVWTPYTNLSSHVHILIFGGCTEGDATGAFCWSLLNESYVATEDIGSRLCRN